MAPPVFGQRGNVMNYAALGDISGVPHEFNFQNTFDYNFTLVQDEYTDPYRSNGKNPHYGKPYANRCSDDTILSMAISEAVMEAGDDIDNLDKITAKYLKAYVKKYPNDGKTFPGWYGTKFVEWAEKPGTAPMTGNPSCGDGSAMRVSAVGWAYDSLEKTLKAAEKTALPSHSHPEGIKGAQAVATAIYLARAGMSKEDIKAYLETKFDYDLDISCKQYQHYNKNELKRQTEICQTTVPMAIRAFLESENYEDCLRKAINLGGDSDTIGAMAGSIAGAMYGMPKDLETKCESLLNDHLMGVSKKFQEFVAARHTEPDKAELAEAMTKARLESYLLQQSKNGSQIAPNQDPKVLDLLVESETARLFYEQVKIARQKGDKDLEKALLDNREDIVEALGTKCKESPELQEKYHSLTSWPVKSVKIEDLDEKYGKRKSGVAKTLPQQRAEVDHAAVAKMSINGRHVIDEVLASKIGKVPEMPVKPKRAFFLARPFLSLYHLIKGDYKSFDQKMTEYTEECERVKRIAETVEKEAPTLVNDQKAGELRTIAQKAVRLERQEGAVSNTQKEAPTLVNDQKAGELRTIAQKTQNLKNVEGVETHQISVALARQILDVKNTLEIKSFEISTEMQTLMRNNKEYSPMQDIGRLFFERKVENYLDQVQYKKVQPNTAFMETLADREKFDEVYTKWTMSPDGKAFAEKFFEKFFHENLRDAMENNPALKSKLDENAKIYDDKAFAEKLVSEGSRAHQKILTDTLNVALDGEMKAMLKNISFIEEFKAVEMQTKQPSAQTVEPVADDMSATTEPNVPV